VTTPTPTPALDAAALELGLADLLRVIRDAYRAERPLDSARLGHQLGWTPVATSAAVAHAKQRLLIWAIRTSGVPAATYDDIELTVQGRRLLRSLEADPSA
jgi:hypothetical protein